MIKCPVYLLFIGLALSGIASAEVSSKTVHTSQVHSLLPQKITDAECKILIPPSYKISLKKDSTSIEEIIISPYLTLHNDHELTKNSEALTDSGSKTFVFTAYVKRPSQQEIQKVPGLSFVKSIL